MHAGPFYCYLVHRVGHTADAGFWHMDSTSHRRICEDALYQLMFDIDSDVNVDRLIIRSLDLEYCHTRHMSRH